MIMLIECVKLSKNSLCLLKHGCLYATAMHILYLLPVKTHIMCPPSRALAKFHNFYEQSQSPMGQRVDYTPLMMALIYIVPEEAEHCPQCLINGHSARFMMMNRDCAVRAATRKKLPKLKPLEIWCLHEHMKFCMNFSVHLWIAWEMMELLQPLQTTFFL